MIHQRDGRRSAELVEEVALRGEPQQPVCMAVVRALSRACGVEPERLDPLYHVVDPEAIDALFVSHDETPRTLAVDFGYRDFDVRVTPDRVTVWRHPED
ncbi:HalOD1 output domain-containing protein [Halogeometricum limi]|uniref:Halobacterial output domain-containing protein n=1 Tax=Halogeometricum limi TaxID=555875 RepID=A0A1I6I127_9EURY|nr:HalOD1 output domain-containing protein [Halogeometricum limi]SFR60405.1 hypothetical protein SAMN04488124_2685 [Halogeometricum limi]